MTTQRTSTRRILAALGFVLMAFLGDRLLAAGLMELVSHSQARLSRLYRGGLDAQILVAGDSRGVTAIYPETTATRMGKSVFSIAHNALSIETIEALLLDYLDGNKTPEIFVLEITCLQSGNGAIWNLQMHFRESARLRGVAEKFDYWGLRAAQVAHLFAFNNDLFRRAMYFFAKDDQSWTNHRSIGNFMLQNEARSPLHPMRLPLSNQIQALRRIVRLADDKGFELRLLVAPYLPEYLSRISNLERNSAALRKAAGVKVWDYSTAITETSLFADRHHLNLQGAKALDALFARDGFL